MKKLLSILLAISMLLFAAGCGGNSADTASTASVSSKASSVQSEKPSSVASQAPVEDEGWYSKDGITFTKADLDKAIATRYIKPKNVIVMIGDGMGLNDIALCNKFSDFKFDFGLVLDHLPQQGLATTHSGDSDVTDSAASATALATGSKTTNGVIGKDRFGKDLTNISEIAREQGKKVGIVTSDSVTGATPSAFAVHNISRNNYDELARSFMKFRPDVLIGNGYASFFSAVYNDEECKPLLDTVNLASSFSIFEVMLEADNEKPFFGFTGYDLTSGDYRLAQATEVALKRLENEKGFFLMVENAGTDTAGHGNDIEAKVDNVACFDKAVAVAVKYCMEHPDTMLIVTSDHETGGVTLPDGDYELTTELFTTTNHTGVEVGVFALGYGTERFNGVTVDNTDIAKFAIAAVKGEI